MHTHWFCSLARVIIFVEYEIIPRLISRAPIITQVDISCIEVRKHILELSNVEANIPIAFLAVYHYVPLVNNLYKICLNLLSNFVVMLKEFLVKSYTRCWHMLPTSLFRYKMNIIVPFHLYICVLDNYLICFDMDVYTVLL